MYFKDINPYKKYELIKTLHSLSLMDFQFSERKKNCIWLNEKMILMADWSKWKIMLLYIKVPNYTRQDRAFRSPNEGESATKAEMHRCKRGVKPECAEEMKMRPEGMHLFLAALERWGLKASPVSDFTSCFPKMRVKMRIKNNSNSHRVIFPGIWIISWWDAPRWMYHYLTEQGNYMKESEDVWVLPQVGP